jgi:CheY-like chemotaxis protein
MRERHGGQQGRNALIFRSRHQRSLDAGRRRALDAGFASYVAKPLDPAALIALVAKVADRSA